MNYGETLAYWYLRLNGFFSLRNFVLHRLQQDDGRHENADVDLLAIRFPYVHEKYGDISSENEPWDDDWDPRLIAALPELKTTITGLIVEVKTGDSVSEPLASFKDIRIRSDIERFGFFDDKKTIDDVVNNLKNNGIVHEKGYCVGKLLISEKKKTGQRLNLTIGEIDAFIRRRMKTFSDPKFATRHMFPDDVIQYIIWREKHES